MCGSRSLVGKLYQLNCRPSTKITEHASPAAEHGSIDLWHQRLGDISKSRLETIRSKKEPVLTELHLPTTSGLSLCHGCIKGKMSRQPFKPVSDTRSKDRLQLVPSNVCGPKKTESLGGCRYFVTFIDDYSHCCAVFMLKHKSEVFKYFKKLNVRSQMNVDTPYILFALALVESICQPSFRTTLSQKVFNMS